MVLNASGIFKQVLNWFTAAFKPVSTYSYVLMRDFFNAIKLIYILAMKSLRILLSLLGLGMLVSCKKSDYQKKDGSVYYKDFRMRSADYDSFQELNAVFAKDKATGYYRGIPLDSSSGASFIALDDHYAKDNTTAFYCDNYIDFKLFETTRKDKIRRIPEADVNSFQAIAYDYAKDRFRAYYKETGFAVVDVATFKPLDYLFGQDKKVGYFNFKPIPESDGPSFAVVSRNFSKDNRAVYYAWTHLDGTDDPGIRVIQGAKPDSFTAVGLYYATDKDHAFYKEDMLPAADPSSFGQWDATYTDYAHDSTQVYFENSLIATAHRASFSILSDKYAKDNQTIFYKADPLKEAHFSSFHVLEYGYAKDAKRVYYEGNVLKGADPVSFTMVTNEADRDAADKTHSYKSGGRVKREDY